MRLILIIFLLLFFSACQKKASTLPTPPEAKPLSVEVLLEGISQCQKDPMCLQQLNTYFTELSEQARIEETLSTDLPEDLETAKQTPLPLDQPADLNQPLLDNPRVQAALNEWLTWKRPKLIETWNNYQFLKAKVWPPFASKNIPEALILGIIAQESGGRVHSMSSAGASGLFQFMPATADRFGVKGTIGDYDARFHPESASKGAALYILEQRQRYGDDYAKILAAYNAGENRFRRLNKKHNNQSVWTNQFFYELPAETQDYIAIVLSAMLIFESPEAFNVTLKTIDGSTALIRAKNDTSLSELAVCFGQHDNEIGWYRILRNLNASIKAKRVIKQNAVVVIPNSLKPVYETQCGDNELMNLAKKIHDADFPDRPVFTWYKIKAGDSLSSISRKFKCSSKREIAQLNKIKAPRYLINAGKSLKVPRC
ncbi:transglycosylase SLT domain-containing protein [Marinicella sediminis]|uniref:Transglycosylase SLT domain-containing protein n=1 Tax=Marinicella sediminis TaxID=1792834 RepID=A0ABV7J9R7_9GAMM|nr:transglycosylase SLT domain-containing protein [Marinicella sediminis]